MFQAYYFAGSLERRLGELHEMFRRTEVRAILCARGGYGCNYLLPHLDLDLIRANPKVFAGCSDVTMLLTYLCDRTGLVTFHAPMVAGDFSRPGGIDVDAWSAAVSSGKAYPRVFIPDDVQPLLEGEAQGMLYGGCLSLLCTSPATAGQRWYPISCEPVRCRELRDLLPGESAFLQKPYRVAHLAVAVNRAPMTPTLVHAWVGRNGSRDAAPSAAASC